MRPSIRAFRAADAPALAEWLDPLAPAEAVCTPAVLVHQRRGLPRRARVCALVALEGGTPVGLAWDGAQIFGSRPGLRRIWVAVRPDRRCRGIGSALWERAEAHALAVGGRTLRSWAIADPPAGERFLLARGCTQTGRELQSWVDPRAVDRDELQRRRAAARRRGFEVHTLREVLPRFEAPVRNLFLEADQAAPGHDAGALVAPATFRRYILENPTLDRDLSVVVMEGERPVSLCWLKGDAAVGRYGVEFTGTRQSMRGRGLASLAKLEALYLAARAGVRWVGTANEESNGPMLAINRRLGHRPLPDLLQFERALPRP